MKVLVIGAGNMGLTYAEGMAHNELLNKNNLQIFDASEKVVSPLKEVPHFDAFDKIEDCLPDAHLVFVAVKPYHADDLFEKMKPMINQQQVFVSLMAGVTIESIQSRLGAEKVVRTMPNLPAQVRKGVTAYTASKDVTKIELVTVRSFLDATGASIHVENEDFINASTGISGSGPAYVFYFMNSMLQAAQKMGFSDHDSKVLVSSTFEGAIKLFNNEDISPQSWMDRVASKGGTTRAALDSMDDNNIKDLIQEAAYAAFDRAVEMGNE